MGRLESFIGFESHARRNVSDKRKDRNGAEWIGLDGSGSEGKGSDRRGRDWAT